MAVKDLDQANMALALAIAFKNTHDKFLFQILEGRVRYENAMAVEPNRVDSVKILAEMNGAHEDLRTFRERFMAATDLDSFETFRRLLTQAQNQVSVVGEFQERIDVQKFYLDVYEQSGIPPQDLPEGEVFNLEKETQKLKNIQAQYDTAVKVLLETVSKLEFKDPSGIVVPKLIQS